MLSACIILHNMNVFVGFLYNHCRTYKAYTCRQGTAVYFSDYAYASLISFKEYTIFINVYFMLLVWFVASLIMILADEAM